ncbi:MAG: MFS transporter [Chloroflexi bacterium]|nr:MFS transporter [Chloroflexota bacterium]
MAVGGLAGVGVLIACLFAVPSVWFLLVITFGFGWFVTPAQAATQTIVQSATTDAVRGRVIGALQASMSTTQIVSIAVAGVVASVIGIRQVFLAGGLICLVAAGIAAALFRMDRRRQPADVAQARAEAPGERGDRQPIAPGAAS